MDSFWGGGFCVRRGFDWGKRGRVCHDQCPSEGHELVQGRILSSDLVWPCNDRWCVVKSRPRLKHYLNWC